MQGWEVLVVVLVALSAALPAVVMRQWQTDRTGAGKTLWLAALYLAYVGVGIVLLFWLAPRAGSAGAGEDKALELTLAMLGWILYGALILMRSVPRYREPPAWLMRFGIADFVLIVLTVICVGAFLWS
jgi:hypothetical protein